MAKLITPGKILLTVSQYYHVPVENILIKDKSKKTSMARFMVIYLLRSKLKFTDKAISRILDRNASTITEQRLQISNYITLYDDVAEQAKEIEEKLLPADVLKCDELKTGVLYKRADCKQLIIMFTRAAEAIELKLAA